MNGSSLIKKYKKLNILCVEDDLSILETYKHIFSVIFNHVYEATDGIEGFKCFQENPIDIILTDFMMPNCDGIEMSRKIREIDGSIPIVMVTAMDNIDIFKKALEVNITSFLNKPFTKRKLFNTFNLAVKSVIADRLMLKEQRYKIYYNDYQENLTFQKEKIITKNDCDSKKSLGKYRCEVYYKPLDTLSGDSFVIKKLGSGLYFIFLVDGMGKGISASTTAMLCSAHINYYINRLIKYKEEFDFNLLLESFCDFIQPNLLEDEVVSSSFLFYDSNNSKMSYATFSMPPVLYEIEGEKSVSKIRSNNPPLSKYTKNFNIDSLEISNFLKILIYTDGLNENSIKQSEKTYGAKLKEDFLNSSNVEIFQERVNESIINQEDDITYIFLKKIKELS